MTNSASNRPGTCQNLELYATSEITEISFARGIALSAGIVAMQIATRSPDCDPAEALTDFDGLRTAFDKRTRPFLDNSDRECLRRAAEHQVTAIRRFLQVLEQFDRVEDFDRAAAMSLATDARRKIVPGISAIMAMMQKAENERQAARDILVAENAALLEGMLAEMGRIGRMISIISINASIEAARAGGESGRAFQVIAQEVRSLAQQSSELLDDMNRRLSHAATNRADA